MRQPSGLVYGRTPRAPRSVQLSRPCCGRLVFASGDQASQHTVATALCASQRSMSRSSSLCDFVPLLLGGLACTRQTVYHCPRGSTPFEHPYSRGERRFTSL